VATARTLFRRYVYGAYHDVVVRTALAGPPVPDRVGDIVFRLATPADLDALGQLDRYGRGRVQRSHVEKDRDWLFVARHGDRIVATRRYSRNVPAHGVMSRVVRLQPGQVWSSDAFCLHEYRNQGLNRRFGHYTMRFLAALGYTEQIGSIAATNIASLRSSRRRGSRPLYYVSYVRCLFYTRLRMSTELPAELEARLPRPVDGP
jgi:hypothetical protein